MHQVPSLRIEHRFLEVTSSDLMKTGRLSSSASTSQTDPRSPARSINAHCKLSATPQAPRSPGTDKGVSVWNQHRKVGLDETCTESEKRSVAAEVRRAIPRTWLEVVKTVDPNEHFSQANAFSGSSGSDQKDPDGPGQM